MAARSESARRVSDCVTALLRDQPFFGSLALRLPIRADATRETLASDGKDIRYAPQWVADTDADHIKTALARVVLACALKHHTRRGGRDAERWQRASQLVTHGLLHDAGFILPPEAEAWDGISAEQAYYDRLPEPSDGEEDQSDACPSRNGDGSGGAVGPQAGDGSGDQNAPSDPTDDGSPARPGRTGIRQRQRGLETIRAGTRQPRPLRHRRGYGRGRAPRRHHRRDSRVAGEHARRGTGVGRGHAPSRQSRGGRKATRRARSKRRSGKHTGASSTGGRYCAAT